MSVKINGLKLLDSNFYNRILIVEKNSNYRIYVKRNQKVTDGIGSLYCIPTEYRFSEELKSKSAEEKIHLIAQKFLEYAKISRIDINYSWNIMLDSFKNITASGTREFKLQLFNHNLEPFSQMILKKYINDRLKFMYENEDINTIYISLEGYTSYEKSTNQINLRLLFKNGKLESYEKEFLENLIYTKLEEIGRHAVIVPICYISPIYMHKESLMDYVLKCGDLSINLGKNRDLIEEVQRIVNNYETNLRNQKIMHMQLKMEGF